MMEHAKSTARVPFPTLPLYKCNVFPTLVSTHSARALFFQTHHFVHLPWCLSVWPTPQ